MNWLIGVLLFALWLLQRLILGEPWYGPDDAYIVVHNAQVLYSGFDQNYGADISPLWGTTSPIFLAIVAALTALMDGPWALDAANVLSAIAYIIGIARIAELSGCDRWQSFLLCVLALILAQTPHQLMNGLETGMALAAITWSIALSLEPDTRRSWVLALVAGSMPYIRPDIAPVGVVLLLRSFALSNWTTWKRDLALSFLTAVPCRMDDGATRNTNSDNDAGEASILRPSARHVIARVVRRRFTFRPDDPDGPRRCRLGAIHGERRTIAETLLRYVGVDLSWRVLVYPAKHPAILSVSLPLSTDPMGGCWVCHRARYKSIILRTMFGATLLVSIALTPHHWQVYLDLRAYARSDLASTAEWVNSNIPPDSVIMVHAAGYTAYGTKAKLVDMVALRSPQVAP